jgi:hypothetical protein
MSGNAKAAGVNCGDHGFTVLDWKSIAKGSLRGAFSIELGTGLIIKNCTVFESGGQRWISLPSRQYQKPDGRKGYSAYVDFKSKALKDKFQQQALAAVDRFLREGSGA